MAENKSSENETPPAATEFEAAAPLSTMEVEFDSAAGGPQADPADKPATATGNTSGVPGEAGLGDTARQAFADTAQKLTATAGDKARAYAEDGKAKAGSLLDDFARLLGDAAGNVDDKLGEQYGNYARTAADTVSGFSGRVKEKDLDELIADARTFVEKSPGVAVGTAAALGFVLVRLVKAGLDANKADAGKSKA